MFNKEEIPMDAGLSHGNETVRMGFDSLEEVEEALEGIEKSIITASTALKSGSLSESDRQAYHLTIESKQKEIDSIWRDLDAQVWKNDPEKEADIKEHIRLLRQVIEGTKS